jgi:ABC-type nickel/cobalt efflux system permease component RcnA/ABC-type uncharacterized transport system substrate-binding protein
LIINKFIYKFIILFNLFLVSNIYACPLCSGININKVNANINISNKNNTTSIEVEWIFDEKYTAEIILANDKNRDKILSSNELAYLKDTIENYIKEKNYLLYIKYFHKDFNLKAVDFIKFDINTSDIEYKRNIIKYRYTLDIDINYQENNILYIRLYDIYNQFRFNIQNSSLSINLDNSISYNQYINRNSTKIQFFKNNIDKEKIADQKQDIDRSAVLNTLQNLLEKVKKSINNLLTDIKEKNSLIAYILLLLFSFLYGMLHAIGPGHGKSLVSAYFLSTNKSYTKAFNMSALIGIVHTFSAFLLTFVVYYILELILSNYYNNIEQIATKVSAIIIIAIAIFLIYKKIIVKKPKIKRFSKSINQSIIVDKPTLHTNSCSCKSCNSDSTELAVVLSAGMVPCTSTVTIFMYSMSMGLYVVGFISALFMSIGMSLVIFFSAVIAIHIKKSSSINSKFILLLEYFSLIFILSLGVILLLF